MLVVKRKPSQSIIINDNITVTVLTCENGYVKLGIDAPKDVMIIRNELLEDIKKQNNESINLSDNTLHMLDIKK